MVVLGHGRLVNKLAYSAMYRCWNSATMWQLWEIACVRIGMSERRTQHSCKHEATLPLTGYGCKQPCQVYHMASQGQRRSSNGCVQDTTWRLWDMAGMQTIMLRFPSAGMWQVWPQVCPGHHIPVLGQGMYVKRHACPGHQVAAQSGHVNKHAQVAKWLSWDTAGV